MLTKISHRGGCKPLWKHIRYQYLTMQFSPFPTNMHGYKIFYYTASPTSLCDWTWLCRAVVLLRLRKCNFRSAAHKWHLLPVSKLIFHTVAQSFRFTYTFFLLSVFVLAMLLQLFFFLCNPTVVCIVLTNFVNIASVCTNNQRQWRARCIQAVASICCKMCCCRLFCFLVFFLGKRWCTALARIELVLHGCFLYFIVVVNLHLFTLTQGN